MHGRTVLDSALVREREVRSARSAFQGSRTCSSRNNMLKVALAEFGLQAPIGSGGYNLAPDPP
jgi:hypothetical protein